MENMTKPTNSITIPNTNSFSTQDSMTVDTMKDICARMAKEMGEAMAKAMVNQQTNYQPQSQGNNNHGNKGWRQYTYYCWSCGCNVKHNSNQCRYREDGHNPAATWENKLGGNTKRDWLRLKWLGPDNKAYQNKGDTQRLLPPQNNA